MRVTFDYDKNIDRIKAFLTGKGEKMPENEKTLEEIVKDLNVLKQEIKGISSADTETFKTKTEETLIQITETIETITLNQITGNNVTSKAFQAIGDALKGIMKMIEQLRAG